LALNVYVTDIRPEQCAKNLDDRSLSIQIMEVATLMSVVMTKLGLWRNGMYNSIAHTDNPWCVWGAASKNNYRWLNRYAQELLKEFKRRKSVDHATGRVINLCWDTFKGQNSRPMETQFTGFVNFTDFRGFLPVPAYRKHLCERVFNSISTWTACEKPDWYYKPDRTAKL